MPNLKSLLMLLVVAVVGAGATLYIDKKHKGEISVVSPLAETVAPLGSSTEPEVTETPITQSQANPPVPARPLPPGGQATQKPDAETKPLNAPVLAGTLKSVNTSCFSDGECSVMIDNTKVVLLIGRYRGPLGKIIGAESIGDLERFTGAQVTVYANKDEDGVYTLLGDESYYLQIAPGSIPAPTECIVGGCSSQLCGEAADIEGIVTTCEYRVEYACYQKASCERQTTGKCGWTETPELLSCLKNS